MAVDRLATFLEHDYTRSQLLPSKRLLVGSCVVTVGLYLLNVSTLTLCAAVFVQAVVILTHNPLVPGMKRTWRISLNLGLVIAMLRVFYLLCRLQGKKTFPFNLETFFSPAPKKRTKLPPSASFGGVKVTRDEFVGVPVTVYRPLDARTPSPAFVFIPGAAYGLGDADLFDRTVHAYVKMTNIVGFLVECHRIPSHPYPAGLNDSLYVTRYVLRHGSRLGIDVTQVGLAGDSAGANMAASIATQLSTEDTGLPPLKFQVLQVPTLQLFDLRLPSHQDCNKFESYIHTLSLAAASACYMGFKGDEIKEAARILYNNKHITPDLLQSKYADYVSVKRLPDHYQRPQRPLPPPSKDRDFDPEIAEKLGRLVLDPRLCPLMAPDLSALPPTFIEAAEFDVLRDEGLLYASRLREAGVEVELYLSRNGFHCDTVLLFPDFLTVESGLNTLQAASDFIVRMVGMDSKGDTKQ